MSSDKHSGSCLGYICTCDELVKTLRAENARYREALQKILITDLVHYDGAMAFAFKIIAREALKESEK